MGNRNIEALTSPLKMGSGSDYMEVATDGTPRFRGASTTWRDMVGDLFGKKLNAVTGRVDYDWDNNAINFQSNGSITTIADRVQANLEINHEFAVGAVTFYPHIHWFQAAAAGMLDTTPFELTMRYRLIRNNYGVNLGTPAWTTVAATANVTNNIFDNTNLGSEDHFGQITRLPDIVLPACGVSDTFQFQMARTDGESGDMLVYFMDLHGAVDSLGSETEYGKGA